MEPIVVALCPRIELLFHPWLWAACTIPPHKMKIDLTAAEPSIAKAWMSDTRAWSVAQGHLPIRYPA